LPKYREIIRGKNGQDSLKLNFHTGQAKIWKSNARFPVLLGGSQVGKTCFAPDWLEREIRKRGPGDYLVVTATFPLLNLKLLPEFRYVFETLYHYGEYKQQRGSHIILFHRDSKKGKVLFTDEEYEREGVQETRIIFGSATNPESIESATAKAAVLDECGMKTWKRDSWEATLRRLSLARGRALLITTLYGYGWLKTEVYDEWEKGNQDFDVVQIDSIVNPSFSLEEYERAQRSMPSWKFDLFYRGRYTKPAGVVYDCFEAEHIVDSFNIPDSWPVYTGHDFGTNNMSGVWLAQNPTTGYLYICQEYLAGGLATHEHIEKWKQMSSGLKLIKRAGGAAHEDGWRGDFTQGGWQISKPTVSSVEEGIQKVYSLLKTRKLYIFRTCLNVLDEIQSYSYELDDKYNPTDKIVDKERYHMLDALRYIASDFNPVDTSGEVGETRWDDDYNEEHSHRRMVGARR